MENQSGKQEGKDQETKEEREAEEKEEEDLDETEDGRQIEKPGQKKKGKKKEPKLTFKTAYDVMLERKNLKWVKTHTPIDELLGGQGIEQEEVIEFYGAYGCGKSQIVFTVSVDMAETTIQMELQKPVENLEEPGPLVGDIIFIDTEGTFKPERITEIAKARGYDPERIVKKIHLVQPRTVDEQMATLKQIPKKLKPALIVIDSLTTLFREEYIGREMLSIRQGMIRKHIRDLKNYVREKKCIGIVTNQVVGNPGATPWTRMEDRETEAGGHTVSFCIDNRFYIRKGGGITRIARLIDSSRYPGGDAVFVITEKGAESPLSPSSPEGAEAK